MLRQVLKKIVADQRERLRQAEQAHRERVNAAEELSCDLRRESGFIVRVWVLVNGPPRAASWLQLKHAEIEMASSRGATGQHLNFLHKRLESAQKQHLAAVRAFIKVCPRGKADREVADRPHDHATGKPSQRRTRTVCRIRVHRR